MNIINWISVEDDMPGAYKDVLCWGMLVGSHEFTSFQGYINPDDAGAVKGWAGWNAASGYDVETVTHWAVMPVKELVVKFEPLYQRFAIVFGEYVKAAVDALGVKNAAYALDVSVSTVYRYLRELEETKKQKQ